jgi:hypothetical protein
MLIDTYLPEYEHHERHSVAIAAAPERIIQAIQEVTPGEIRLWRTLFGLRALPARLLGRRSSAADIRPLLEQIRRLGFVQLGDTPGVELVFGGIGQPWRVTGSRVPAISGAEAYLRFAEPGYAKMALNFHLQPLGARGPVQVSTETRVHLTDARARRRFGRYWLLIAPFSALLRLTMLHAIKHRAEQGLT